MSWKDIVGHESQIKYLIHAWQTNRLGQAYFFHGPDGVGKRTLAIEFGKALLCQSNNNYEACGVCASCKLVEAENHPDLQTNGCPKDVHEFPRELMKEICEGFFLKASRGGAKVLVIDDCDLLNEESGNIFLKSLEEPPPHSIIFLIGTSVERQLETILSRCQKLAFHGLNQSEIAKVFAINQIDGSFDLNKITSDSSLVQNHIVLKSQTNSPISNGDNTDVHKLQLLLFPFSHQATKLLTMGLSMQSSQTKVNGGND